MLIYLTLHSAYTVIYLPVRQVQQKYTVFIPFVLPNKNVKHNQRSTNNMPKIAIHVGMLNLAYLDLVFSVFLKLFFIPA